MDNRKIKFRVWDKNLKLMAMANCIKYPSDYVYPQIYYRYKNKQTGKIIDECALFGSDDGCDTVRVMQYTGLKDKNGKDVYEGDIIRTKMFGKEIGNANFNDIDYFSIVYKGASFKLENNTRTFYFTKETSKSAEIIGNIYENSELLKGCET
ncbi:YopX family protein [Megasphaera sueciensis]|uniref:YopX family protein n=1 Tax=Megasphaera sueciensis TaxID=349094 RepID=UPI003D07FBFA